MNGVSVETLKFFSPNYYLNLASLVSLEYLPEAIKEEVSSSESNISRIKNIISSVQTLDAYRQSNDPVYTDKYNGTLSVEFSNIASYANVDIGENSIAGTGGFSVIGTDASEKDNEDENDTNNSGEVTHAPTEMKKRRNTNCC